MKCTKTIAWIALLLAWVALPAWAGSNKAEKIFKAVTQEKPPAPQGVDLVGTPEERAAVQAARAADKRFAVVGNGTVIDLDSGLMWAAKDNGRDIKWTDAKSYAEAYRGGAYANWRLPTIAELRSLHRPGRGQTVPCNTGFQVQVDSEIQFTCYLVWTSEDKEAKAAAITLDVNFINWYKKKDSSSTRVLPVRTR